MICWDDLEQKISPHFSALDKDMYDRAKSRYPLLAKAFLVTEVITKYQEGGRPSNEFLQEAHGLIAEIRQANERSDPFLQDQVERLMTTMEEHVKRLEQRRMLN